jgi:nucleoside-diphosphate-sugar epimerase
MEQTRIANIKKTYDSIGWKPQTPLTIGLQRTVDWYREQAAV